VFPVLVKQRESSDENGNFICNETVNTGLPFGESPPAAQFDFLA